MGKKRQIHSGPFKAKVVLEALREQDTLAVLSSRHGVHANVISKWKKTVRDGLPALLSGRQEGPRVSDEQLTARLYEEIGRLKMELDYLKKTR